MNKKVFIGTIAGSVAFVLMVVACINLLRDNSEFARYFQSFSLTVINESDSELTSVELGILQSDASGNATEGNSKYFYPNSIESGQKTVIRPRLTIQGEGGIYLKYKDSSGKEKRKAVCSYTESASGYSTVTISNDKVKVEEKCI